MAVAMAATLGAAAATRGADFIRGVDLSVLQAAQDGGVVYRGDDGRPADPLAVLRGHGVNLVRLRLFVAPDGTDGQVNTLPYTLRLARRVKAAGLRLLLDLHYSDGWADPGKQVTPAAWRTLPHAALVDRVHAYTRQTLAAFDRAGARPDVVEVGNEVTDGMLWPDGGPIADAGNWNAAADPTPRADAPWDRFADLLTAGVRGVHDADPTRTVRIMIHIDKGGSPAVARWFFDHLVQRGVRFDLIGLSYYPFWHGSLDGLAANLASLSAAYGKDVVVVETGYDTWGGPQGSLPFPLTPDGQRAFLATLIRTVAATPGGHGDGVCYWAPEWIDGPRWRAPAWSGQWEQRALFDAGGRPRPAVAAFATPVGTPATRP